MSATVYFGRIPYDYTEEQVGELARSAGPVSAVRLMFDKDSGKSKGFAFVDYVDKESAASAVRNLNNYQVGSQHLRVDFSGDAAPVEGEKSIYAIADIINGMKENEKSKFLADFKSFASSNGPEASLLLQKHPQLAYALVQTMIDRGKIDHKQADSLLRKKVQQPPKKERKRGGNSSAPSSKASTPQPPSVPQSTSGPQSVDENQRQMIMQVMSFTDQQVDQLPLDQRQAVVDIRERVKRGEIVL